MGERRSWVQAEARPGMSLAQVAAVMGISRARVLQIEQEALRKLARMPEARKLLACAVELERNRHEENSVTSGQTRGAAR